MFLFIFVLGNILNSKDEAIIFIGLDTILTIIFCTYTVIDKVDKNFNE